MNIPFTTAQFFEVIEKYNTSVFPMQLILLILGLAAFVMLHLKSSTFKNKYISLSMGVLWIWIGIAYHLAFFTSINKAAYGFGGLFIVQGIFFVIEAFRGRLNFEFTRTPINYIGYFFIVYGLIIYPVLSFFLEGSLEQTIILGLPCPTTIMTFGFFMVSGKSFPRYLVIIPTLWAIIGTGAAVKFGVYQDYIMLLSAIIADFVLLKRKK